MKNNICIIAIFIMVGNGLFAEDKNADLVFFQSVLDKTARTGKDILVFIHGSDWSVDGELVKKKIWDGDKLSKKFPDVILHSMDFRDGPDEERKALEADANKGFPIPLRDIINVPALVYLDCNALPIGIIRGVEPDSSFDSIAGQIDELRSKRIKRDSFWDKAKSASGPEKTLMMGKGLDVLGWNPRLLKYYKQTIAGMAKEDTQDPTGYVQKYQFTMRSHARVVKEHLRQKKYEDAMEYIEVLLRNDKLDAFQKQQLHAIRSWIYAEWPGHKQQAKDALRKVISLDSKSTTGMAAANILKKMAKKQNKNEKLNE